MACNIYTNYVSDSMQIHARNSHDTTYFICDICAIKANFVIYILLDGRYAIDAKVAYAKPRAKIRSRASWSQQEVMDRIYVVWEFIFILYENVDNF